MHNSKFIITNGSLLSSYKKLSDKKSKAKNFRLFYHEEPTNLIWYDGKIIYLPKECFELKNLVNIDINKREKCALFMLDMKLIRELEEQKINFLLESNLEELLRRLKGFSLQLLEGVGVELIDSNDYSKIIEPVYLGNGVWLNLD